VDPSVVVSSQVIRGPVFRVHVFGRNAAHKLDIINLLGAGRRGTVHTVLGGCDIDGSTSGVEFRFTLVEQIHKKAIFQHCCTVAR
jgi:hypothetical protein